MHPGKLPGVLTLLGTVSITLVPLYICLNNKKVEYECTKRVIAIEEECMLVASLYSNDEFQPKGF